MADVLLLPDGALLADGKPFEGDALGLLGRALALDAACTLRSVFLLVRRHADLARLSPFLPGFLAAYPGWPEAVEPLPGLVLRLGKVVEMVGIQGGEGGQGGPRLDIYVTLAGWADDKEVAIKVHPVETLLGTPLALGRLTHRVFGDAMASMAFDTAFSLFEVLEAIAWQLAFHGAPAECALPRR